MRLAYINDLTCICIRLAASNLDAIRASTLCLPVFEKEYESSGGEDEYTSDEDDGKSPVYGRSEAPLHTATAQCAQPLSLGCFKSCHWQLLVSYR